MKEEEEKGKYKFTEKIPFQHVSLSMYYKLANKLDPDNSVVGNNWRLLAEKLGYSTEAIFVFECQQSQHGRNTIKVLQDYSQKHGSTVNALYRALEEIERPDALDELKDGLPEIEKAYRDSLRKRHRHQDIVENDYICSSCEEMPYTNETYPHYAQSHQESLLSPGNGFGLLSRNVPVSTSGKVCYQRHKSLDPQCRNTPRLPSYDHESPEFKRQRSMPLTDSMMVRGHDNHSQYYREVEPMEHSPSLREDPVPLAIGLMRGIPRFNHHGVQQMNSRIHTKDSEALFRQPYSQFGRQTERAGLKLEIPSSSDILNRQRLADFCSPSPTPTTPSTPLGRLTELAYDRQFQPEDGYKDLMKMKHDEELLQGKAGNLDSPDKMMEFMSHQNSGMLNPGHHGEGQGQMRTSPRINGPPNTFPLRLKSSQNSVSSTTSPTSSSQLTKSASVPGNLKPAEFRKAFRHIKVFVTYAADDKKHTQRVLSLCKCLEKNGFKCCVDIFHRKLPLEERHGWYQKRFEEADFILVVMSQKYRIEADSCEMENDADDSDSVDSDGENNLDDRPYKLHTKNIYRLMYREYVQSGQRCMRFVPLIFRGMAADIIPDWMLDTHNRLFYFWPEQYKDLLWMLTKPENRVPERVTPPINRCPQDGEGQVRDALENSVESE